MKALTRALGKATRREQVMRMYLAGSSLTAIGVQLGVSPAVVKGDVEAARLIWTDRLCKVERNGMATCPNRQTRWLRILPIG